MVWNRPRTRDRRDPPPVEIQTWYIVNVVGDDGKHIETLGGLSPYPTAERAAEGFQRYLASRGRVFRGEIIPIKIKINPGRMP